MELSSYLKAYFKPNIESTQTNNQQRNNHQGNMKRSSSRLASLTVEERNHSTHENKKRSSSRLASLPVDERNYSNQGNMTRHSSRLASIHGEGRNHSNQDITRHSELSKGKENATRHSEPSKGTRRLTRNQSNASRDPERNVQQQEDNIHEHEYSCQQEPHMERNETSVQQHEYSSQQEPHMERNDTSVQQHEDFSIEDDLGSEQGTEDATRHSEPSKGRRRLSRNQGSSPQQQEDNFQQHEDFSLENDLGSEQGIEEDEAAVEQEPPRDTTPISRNHSNPNASGEDSSQEPPRETISRNHSIPIAPAFAPAHDRIEDASQQEPARETRRISRNRSIPTQDRNDSSQNIPPENEAPTEQVPPRRKRRLTRNLALRKLKKRRPNYKLNVSIPPSHRRATGENSQAFITEAGVCCRMNAPLPTVTWKHLDSGYKDNMLKELRLSFEIPVEAEDYVMHQFNKQYNQWKHHLYQRFLHKRHQPPEGMSPENWDIMCEYFLSDDTFKQRSNRNKGNRAKLTVRHQCGTKSFARVEAEMTKENDGVQPDAVRYWQRTHQKEDGTWTDARAEEIMTGLQEAAQTHEQTHEPDDAPLPLEEHLAKVVPPRAGYQVGRGWGPRPANHVPRRTNPANEVLRAQNAELGNRVEELQAQLEQQNVRIQTAEASIEARIQAQVEAKVQGYFDRIFHSRPSA